MIPRAPISKIQASLWALLIALGVVSLPGPLQARDNPAPTSQLSAAAEAVAQAINQQRAHAGLPALAVHPLLNLAAQNHVNDMIHNGARGHIGSDGSRVRQRVQRVGYSSGGFASENWVNATGVEGAMGWWMNDWIHRENILNTRWKEVGIGVGDSNGRQIFVTVFTAGGGADDGVVTPLPDPGLLPVGGAYTIQAGDTLIAIAVRYGLDWTMIAASNQLNESTILQIGQVIRIPGAEGGGGAAPASNQTSSAANAGPRYTVQSGDTLLAIASRYGMGWETLAAANNLTENDLLQIGQNLVVPGQAAANSNSTTGGFVQASGASSASYRVQPGDTLLSIAIRNGMSWETLAAANNLSGNDLLQIDQALTIPGQTTSAAPTTGSTQNSAAQPTARYHTVTSGETVITIAAQYGLNWSSLLRLNGFSETTVLQIGQQIRLE